MVEAMRSFHFIGVGGAGMSALAHILLEEGYRVSGSDLTESPLLDELRALGGTMYVGHDAAHLGVAEAVVVSTAIRDENPELVLAREKGLPVLHRSDINAMLLNRRKGIAVAGAHGKTTTTAMLGVVLDACQVSPTIIIGGESPDLGTNAKLGKSDYLVSEADESDGSFVKLLPHFAVVTNIEDDHLDHYGTMEALEDAFVEYVNNVKAGGCAILCYDSEKVREISPRVKTPVISYGLETEADYQARDIRAGQGGMTFTLLYRGEPLGEISIHLPGRHNVANALAAIAVGREIGLSVEALQRGLDAFHGAKRRFQTKYREGGVWIVDDYAHHPTEIEMTLQAARQTRPKRLVCAFQPHRYTRTELLADEFGRSFGEADVLILTDVYAAGEDPIPGVDGRTLVEAVKRQTGKDAVYIEKLEDIAPYLAGTYEKGDLILSMGAGDIYLAGEELAKRLGGHAHG